MTCVCVWERECYTYPLQQYFFPAAHVHFVVLKDWRPSLCIMATQKIEIPLAGINLKVFTKCHLNPKRKGSKRFPRQKSKKRRLGPRYDPSSAILSVHICWRYCFWVFFTFQGVSQGDFSLPSLMCASSSKGNTKQLRCNLKSDRCPIFCMTLLLLFSNWMQMFQ